MKPKTRLLLPFLLFAASCEKEIELEIPDPAEKIVVEGYVENGAPPFVILTRNLSLSAKIDLEALENIFVHDAVVTVSDGQQMVTLQEFASDQLPQQILESIEMDIPDNFTFYFYTTFSMFGEVGKKYELNVTSGEHVIQAATTLPDPIPLDTLWYQPSPIETKDSLVLLYVVYDDPPGTANFARYFTQRNSEPFFTNYFNSVFDDRIVNGERVEFVLERGQSKSDTIDWDTYGYFWRGDTVTVKWCAIDKEHYEFWRSFEQQQATGDNPFSSPTIIRSNIEGGLGIWGGNSCSYHSIIIP